MTDGKNVRAFLAFGEGQLQSIRERWNDNADSHTHYDAHQAFQVNNQHQPQKGKQTMKKDETINETQAEKEMAA